jgi:hypothetical protein
MADPIGSEAKRARAGGLKHHPPGLVGETLDYPPIGSIDEAHDGAPNRSTGSDLDRPNSDRLGLGVRRGEEGEQPDDAEPAETRRALLSW